MADLRGDLLSGDAAKQTGAVMSALAALAAGRDVAPLVSAAVQLLGNPTAAAEVKCAAYGLALTAQLSDAGALGCAWLWGAARCRGRSMGQLPQPA